MPLLRPHQVEIDLTLDRAEARAGEVLGATISVSGPDASRLSALVVELGYTGEFDYRAPEPAPAGLLEPIDSHGATGSGPSGPERVGSAEVLVASAELSPDPGRFELDLELPADAPGSGRELAGWWVRARAERRRGDSLCAEAPFRLVREAPARDAADQWVEGDGICTVELRLDFNTLLAGGTLSGAVVLTAKSATKPADVSIGFERRRTSFPENEEPSGPWLRRIESTDAARGAELTVGEPLELPFELELPADLAPTCEARDSAIAYELQAFVSYGLTANDVVRREVLLGTATG